MDAASAVDVKYTSLMETLSTAEKPLDPLVAELLRARKSRGMRQQEVADKAGISRRSLVTIEAGGDCTLSTLRGLCAALDVEIAAKAPAAAAKTERSFATAEAMSAYQEERDLAEALRVQAMLPFERSRWLAANWGALQEQALSFHRDLKPANVRAVRHFATMEEKNQYDEELETERALQLALSRGG